jgi:hypothetical protein
MPPETSLLPSASGLNATQVTRSVWPRSVKTACPVVVSQTLTVRSELAVAIRLPSGLKTTSKTSPVWPLSVKATLPLAVERTSTSLPRHSPCLPCAKSVPSGLPAAALSRAAVGGLGEWRRLRWRGLVFLSSVEIPEPRQN